MDGGVSGSARTDANIGRSGLGLELDDNKIIPQAGTIQEYLSSPPPAGEHIVNTVHAGGDGHRDSLAEKSQHALEVAYPKPSGKVKTRSQTTAHMAGLHCWRRRIWARPGMSAGQERWDDELQPTRCWSCSCMHCFLLRLPVWTWLSGMIHCLPDWRNRRGSSAPLQ